MSDLIDRADTLRQAAAAINRDSALLANHPAARLIPGLGSVVPITCAALDEAAALVHALAVEVESLRAEMARVRAGNRHGIN